MAANYEELIREFTEVVRRGNEILKELRKQQTSDTFKQSSDNVEKETLKDSSNDTIKNNRLENKVSSILHALSLPAHIKGYSYVRTAIIMTIKNPNMVHAVTKELYPDVAKHYGTTPSRVERAIRHGIESAWLKADAKDFEEVFGYSIISRDIKPTNSEFIAKIADRIMLEGE